MSDPKQPDLPAKGQFLVYLTEDGRTKIEVRLENETVWLTQQHMADLFQTSKQNVGQYLKNIFEEGELAGNSVVKNFFTTAADGKDYRTNFYNLDAIKPDDLAQMAWLALRLNDHQQASELVRRGLALENDNHHLLNLAQEPNISI